MDLDPTEETLKLKAELRVLIEAEAPHIHMRNGTRLAESEIDWQAWKAWSAKLYDRQFFGRNWPLEYGGVPGATPFDDFMVAGEIASAHVPSLLFFATLAAHAIIESGTEDQKRRFLPPTRSSELVWCQLFSEPGGGSDLAALTTRAERRGGDYVINGQKVWNTQAQMADYGFLLARTSREGSKHAGITAFLVSMRQPGVTIRPIREITGTSDFNEVFFENAIVPIDDRLGEEGAGWDVATKALAKERLNTALYALVTGVSMRDLIDAAKDMRADGPLPDGCRQRLVELYAACRVTELLGMRLATREHTGRMGIADPPITKSCFSEAFLGLATFALQLYGDRALFEEDDSIAADGGRWKDMFLYARANTIAGGSSEIMRNILSERVLGMPRG